MGQSQSAEKVSSRGGDPNRLLADPHRERDRKVNRRISVQTLTRRDPADASASNVAAHGTTTHNIDTSNIEKMLQSTSPELTSKSRVERSTSRKKREPIREEPLSQPGPEPERVNSIDIPQTLPTRSRSEEEEKIYDEPTYVPVSHHRPPRLPLPIAEVPDSPNLGPISKTDSDVPIFSHDDSDIPRRNSMLSVATQEEEDVGEELQPFGVGYTGQTVPYTIEWNRPAEKVFVTGTFAAWDKKYRLRKRQVSDTG